jgi:hypothetical protein
MPGGRAIEAEIHGRFAHLRLGKTEQFRPGPDLMAFIGREASIDPDTVKAAEPKMTVVKADVDLVRKAKTIAEDKGVDLSEYLSELIRGPITRDWDRIMRRVMEAEGGEE